MVDGLFNKANLVLLLFFEKSRFSQEKRTHLHLIETVFSGKGIGWLHVPLLNNE